MSDRCPHTTECACDPGPLPDDPRSLIELHAAEVILDRAMAFIADDVHRLHALTYATARLALVDLTTVAVHLRRALVELGATE